MSMERVDMAPADETEYAGPVDPAVAAAAWRRSSYCANGSCVGFGEGVDGARYIVDIVDDQVVAGFEIDKAALAGLVAFAKAQESSRDRVAA